MPRAKRPPVPAPAAAEAHTRAQADREALLAEASFYVETVQRSRLEGAWMPVAHSGVSDKIYLPLRGRGTLLLAEGSFDLYPGRVAIVPAGALQQGVSDPDDPLEKLWVHFSAQTTGTLHLLRFFTLPRCIEGPTAARIQPLLEAMFEEWRQRRPGRQLALKMLLMQALLLACRADPAEHRPPDRPGVAPPDAAEALRRADDDEQAQTVRRVLTLITGRYDRPLALADLADHAGLSPAYLNSLFSRLVGTPPMKFLESVRMRRAQAMLGAGDRPVGEIAHAVGFRDANYFSRAFARYTGVSPSAYRAAARASYPKKIQS